MGPLAKSPATLGDICFSDNFLVHREMMSHKPSLIGMLFRQAVALGLERLFISQGSSLMNDTIETHLGWNILHHSRRPPLVHL
jgi:hypothetical protein